MDDQSKHARKRWWERSVDVLAKLFRNKPPADLAVDSVEHLLKEQVRKRARMAAGARERASVSRASYNDCAQTPGTEFEAAAESWVGRIESEAPEISRTV